MHAERRREVPARKINPVAAQREFENLEGEMIAADIDLLRKGMDGGPPLARSGHGTIYFSVW